MIRNIFLLLLLMINNVLFSQIDTTIITEDFNKDGYTDTLETGYDGGSDFGGYFVTSTNGKTKEIFHLETYGSFSDIKRVIVIPKALSNPENQIFLDMMIKQIFPEYKEKPDGSLQWIINGFHNLKKINDNEYFDLIINPKLKWETDKIDMPYMYYTKLDKKTTQLMVNPTHKKTENDSTIGFIVYYGHNHYRFTEEQKDSLVELAKNEKYKVYRTSHGVLVKKGEKHKWVFVTDLNITGAPGKLRWESIDKVFLKDEHLIIKQTFPVFGYSQIYLLNIDSGVCGRIKKEIVKKTNCLFDKNYVNMLIKELNSFKY